MLHYYPFRSGSSQTMIVGYTKIWHRMAVECYSLGSEKDHMFPFYYFHKPFEVVVSSKGKCE